MNIGWNILRVAIASITIVAVAELSNRHPRLGALLLSLPLVSVLAFTMSWMQHRDITSLARMARDTLILVPLGLVFFIPLALAERLRLSFSVALAAGIVLTIASLGTWLLVAPES